MADLERLVDIVHRRLGRKRIWLTEFGYQTNPPDLYLGVSPLMQAAHVASAARRVQLAPYVDMLIFFLVRDDEADEGWQSGFTTADGETKPAYAAFRFPLVQTFRRGELVGLWGQVRPRDGPQPYRIEILRNGAQELARRRALDGLAGCARAHRTGTLRLRRKALVRARSRLQPWPPRLGVLTTDV